jgi:UDP-2,4-diacetamido-2,4,6-trideoxy-beta-L-altropyranose hydrolase
MNFAFRVDASSTIGTGHFMRCLTLALELKKMSANIRFITRHLPSYLVSILKVNAIEHIRLESKITGYFGDLKHSSWLGVSQEKDANMTIQSLSDMQWDWIVVDHYALDIRWESTLNEVCTRLMVIDDLADRQHECDLLLDQNLGRIATDYSGLVSSNCIVLAGPRFALLRPEFAEFREYSLHRRTTSKIDSLLITMGGIDQDDATGKILEALKDCPLSNDCEIIVLMGADAPWLSRVKLLGTEMPWPTKVKVNVQNMAELMANSDLAIGAAGSTSWERCCLGLPTLIVVLAENQIKVADALAQNGCAKVLGPPDAISKNLRPLLHMLTIEKLCQMTQSSSAITDGQGVDRIRHILLENHV